MDHPPSELRGDTLIKWGYAVSSVITPPRTWADARERVRLDLAEPRANDIVVAEVMEIGEHTRIDLRDFDRSTLFVGDLVGMAFGPRYATRHYQAIVPPSLDDIHLVAPGGVCGRVVAVPDHLDAPTRLRVLGYLVDSMGRRINLRDHATRPAARLPDEVDVLAVVGSSMDSGKTTAAASLVNGLTRGGRRVAAIKVTGTASAKDIQLFRDAGAVQVLDFTTAGFAVTADVPLEDLWQIVEILLSHLVSAKPDTVILELADGITQRETHALLDAFARTQILRGIIYTCNDALGVSPGIESLKQRLLPVLAVSGIVTATPLARQEAQRETDVPVLGREDLCDRGVADRLRLGAGIANRRPSLS
jgi:methylmalonyl-CoA mutase cobalamin-binding subunit